MCLPTHLFAVSFEQFSSTNVCARCLSLDDTATNDIDDTDRSAGTTFAFAISAVDMQVIVLLMPSSCMIMIISYCFVL